MKSAALLAATFLLPAWAWAGDSPEIAAEVRFDIGSDRVALVLVRRASGESSPFYELGRPISYPGLEDHPECFEAAGSKYHHEACAVLQEFFRQNDFDSESISLGTSPGYPEPEAGEDYSEGQPPEEDESDTEGYGEHSPRYYGAYADYPYYRG